MDHQTRSLLHRRAVETARTGDREGLALTAAAILAVWAHADLAEAGRQLRFLAAVYRCARATKTALPPDATREEGEARSGTPIDR